MERLIQGAQKLLGLTLTPHQVAAFQLYHDELLAWNARFNLTAITDPVGIQIRHFLDSLSCLLAMGETEPGARLVDVGSGAGFPGLPLKIVRPDLQVTLVESTRKKTDFCRHVVQRLGLRNVVVVHGRAEAVGHEPAHREAYDWALARAVATLPTLVEYLLPLCRVGGRCLAQKGEGAVAEVHRAEAATRLLGGAVNRLVPVELPGLVETRYLVVLDKVACTPDKYPRRPGMPVKRPLG